MKCEKLKNLIDISCGRQKAELVIKNCKVVNVYSGDITEADIAIFDGIIAGIGKYAGEQEIDAKKAYAIPGLIESHMHIESSFLTPQNLAKLIVPHGTTTIIADPHEIVNVCGTDGFNYMYEASLKTDLDIKLQIPSCVPCTEFEHSGAVIDSKILKDLCTKEASFGIGEFMNYPGILFKNEEVMKKISHAKEYNKIIDGHAPGLSKKELNAYVAAGVTTDHECSTVEEMLEKLNLGMYIQLRHGSACHNLKPLLKGITNRNSRRCLLCSDDRQPKDIIEKGDLDEHLRICVKEGIDPVTAISMASLNAAECYNLKDRGAIAPGLRADIVLIDNLKDFNVLEVFIKGKTAAKNGIYCGTYAQHTDEKVLSCIKVKDFNISKLNLNSSSDKVKVISIVKDDIITALETVHIQLDENKDFVFNENEDIVKIVVVERHKMSGNVSVGLLKGYGLKKGALAQTIAHDSHNIIAVGTNNEDIFLSISKLMDLGGGVVLSNEGKTVQSLSLPIAGLISDKPGEEVAGKLEEIHKLLIDEFKVHSYVDPLMTLAFMSLPVIPEIKITDMGLFDVNKFEFTCIEAE